MELSEHPLASQLLEICDHEGGFEAARSRIIDHTKAAYAQARDELSDKVKAAKLDAAPLRKDYAALTDDIIGALFTLIWREQGRTRIATEGEKLSIIAVGGYGRNEMAPYSDVDLLFLIPHKQTGNIETLIETLLYLLWDIGFKLGHSVRSSYECYVQARADMTIRTALLEQRFLFGNRKLADTLVEELRSNLFDKTIPEFVEAKLEEREKRHARSGNIRYVLEPNVKEAKGGLRDLQTLYWLGKYITGADTPEELMDQGFFHADELAQFREAEEFLWSVRMMLHELSGRANDVLSFDMQVELARAFGFEDQNGRRGVEIFMQSYFRAARQVGELTRVFLTELEARHVWRSRPSFVDFLRSSFQLDAGLHYENGRINFDSESVLIDEPIYFLKIFANALKAERLLHPNAFRYMARHHELIDDEFRNDEEANALFLSLLLDYQNPERVLRRMNEIGILGAFIPQWAEIDAMMQYNMYHSYTVDEHTIQCLSVLSDIEKGKLEEHLPVASEILRKGVNRRVLFLALLFHDIGKGRARPHELVGEEIARELSPRFGLSSSEAELVTWLVRHHLEMSDAAQKKDLSDPKTVADFAALVDTQEKLDLLTVLTVCDIRGVGPTTWNNWKAMLLRELYALTSDALREGGAAAMIAREEEAKEALRAAFPSWPSEQIDYELERHYSDYWIGLSTQEHIELAELLHNEIDDERAQVRFSPDLERDATRISFVMPDHPGLFARLCGAVSLSGANIVDARTYTSSDGIATAVLWVQDKTGTCYAPSRQTLLETNTLKVLHGKVIAREALAERSQIKKREREFKVPTRIHFDNDGSRIFTIIQIETRDRLGLLHDVSRALAASNISISSAIVATYGEEAVDSFYVKDLFGLKIYSESKQKAIEAKLRQAIEQGYEEALQ